MTGPRPIHFALCTLLVLAACGGGSGRVSGVPLASGPIADACNSSSRDARNPEICGCAQQTANLELTNADQRRATDFFGDPQAAQDARTSDRARDEAFWTRYRAFLTRFERTCRAAV